MELEAAAPDWSNGDAVATFSHSVICAMLLVGTPKAALAIPPGLFG